MSKEKKQPVPAAVLVGRLHGEILTLASIARRTIGATDTNFFDYRMQWQKLADMITAINGDVADIIANASGKDWKDKLRLRLAKVQPDPTKWPPKDSLFKSLGAFKLEKETVEDDPFLTPEAVGRKLNKSGVTIRRWIRDGVLTGIRYPSKFGRSSFGVRTSEVQKFIDGSAMDAKF